MARRNDGEKQICIVIGIALFIIFIGKQDKYTEESKNTEVSSETKRGSVNSDDHAPFNIDERRYGDAEGFASVNELEHFLTDQRIIFFENVYGVLQKYFYGLLARLPRSSQTDEIKVVVDKIDAFFDVERDHQIVYYDHFLAKCSTAIHRIGELVKDEEYKLRQYRAEQLSSFVEHAGKAVKLFLESRPFKLSEAKESRLRYLVDELHKSESFLSKSECLNEFIRMLDPYVLLLKDDFIHSCKAK